MAKDEAKVRLYEESLAPALEEFCKTAWPGRRSSIQSPGTFPSEMGGARQFGNASPTFIFLKGEKAVGHVATIPVRLWIHGREMPAHWIVGFMVLPEYRNGLVGPLLIKETNRTLDCALSLHVQSTVLRILTGLSWVHKGLLPQYIKVLNAAGVAKNIQPSGVDAIRSGRNARASYARLCVTSDLVRWAASFVLTLWQMSVSSVTYVTRPKPNESQVLEEHKFDESYTKLWRSISSHIQAGLVRDQTYLETRFRLRIKQYRLLACRQDEKLLGYCIIKIKTFANDGRMGNMKVGTIVDCLYDPTDSSTLQSLLRSATELFERERADVLLCTASLSAIRRLLLANGFFRIPGNLHFAYHSRSPVVIDDTPLESWHLMRGDSDADQNF